MASPRMLLPHNRTRSELVRCFLPDLLGAENGDTEKARPAGGTGFGEVASGDLHRLMRFSCRFIRSHEWVNATNLPSFAEDRQAGKSLPARDSHPLLTVRERVG